MCGAHFHGDLQPGAPPYDPDFDPVVQVRVHNVSVASPDNNLPAGDSRSSRLLYYTSVDAGEVRLSELVNFTVSS